MLLGLIASNLVGAAHGAVKAEVLENRKIWDQGAHNAFTDLIHWKDRWWCTFREAEDHVGGDGTIRTVIEAWPALQALWADCFLSACPNSAEDAVVALFWAARDRHADWRSLDPRSPSALR